MPVSYRKLFTDVTEEELINMTRDEACLNLNDKQKAFCEYYIGKYNVITAAAQAGYTRKNAHAVGWKIRQDPDCNRYLAWLKLRVCRESHIDAIDIIDQYIRIAFADITDFVELRNGKARLKEGTQVDGQIITKVKSGKDGITIELADKLSALDKLERYFNIMPADWKQKIEEKKVELMEKRIEIERMKLEGGGEPEADDGFLDALKSSAKEVWEDENDEG